MHRLGWSLFLGLHKVASATLCRRDGLSERDSDPAWLQGGSPISKDPFRSVETNASGLPDLALQPKSADTRNAPWFTRNLLNYRVFIVKTPAPPCLLPSETTILRVSGRPSSAAKSQSHRRRKKSRIKPHKEAFQDTCMPEAYYFRLALGFDLACTFSSARRSLRGLGILFWWKFRSAISQLDRIR